MSNRDKITFITFLITFLAYNIVGYVFDIDVLKFIVFRNDGFSLSFVAIIVPTITAYLIYYVLKHLNIKVNYNENKN